jgi:hypothetical protein
MPLNKYGLLVGRAVDCRREGGTDTPHYQVRIDAAGTSYRIAVSVLSQESPSELLYLADDDFRHPSQMRWPASAPAGTTCRRAPGSTSSAATSSAAPACGRCRRTPPGPTTTCRTSSTLNNGVALGNKGGSITLLDRGGLKVAGVAYTAEQAREEGWAVTF